MTDRELDALVAKEVMGLRFEWVRERTGWYETPVLPVSGRTVPVGESAEVWFEDYVLLNERKQLVMVPGGMTYETIPHYSTDIAAAFEMEGQIGTLDARAVYVIELMETLSIGVSELSDGTLKSEKTVYELMRATPRQRCIAALKAVGVAVE